MMGLKRRCCVPRCGKWFNLPTPNNARILCDKHRGVKEEDEGVIKKEWMKSV